MSITYRVVIKDPYGRSPLYTREIISLQAARSVNSVGAAQLILPGDMSHNYWQRDMQVELWRETSDGHSYLLGDTIWFARRFVWRYDQKQWEVNLEDANTILNRRLVAYTAETTYAEKTEEWGTEGPADDLMKAYMRENFGSLVLDTDRDLSAFLDIEADRSLGPITQKDASFREVLSVLTDLVNDAANLDGALYFNVHPLPNGRFIFRVTKGMLGQNRSLMHSQVRFGPAFRNLTEIEIEYEYSDEKTYVYAGGDGEGAGRLLVEVEDDLRSRRSPFGRIETFYDGKDQDDENALTADARAALNKAKPKLRLTGKVVDTPNIMFGRDYFYGDLVKAIVGDIEVDCLIDAFSVSFEAGVERELDIRLKGELGI